MISKEKINKQLQDVASQLGDMLSSNLSEEITFEDKKLFTVVLAFSDHADGIGQFEANSPRQALEMFIEKSEALEGYERNHVKDAIKGLWQASELKGVWSVVFTPLASALDGPDENTILGGLVIMSDQCA
jgi:protein-tyrosine-phosphatase